MIPPKKVSSKEINDRIDMVELLNDIGFTDVDPDAEEQLLFCVFHNDIGTKSFSVNTEKKIFRCFSPKCALSGNALTLYAIWKQVSLDQAIHELQFLPKRRNVDSIKRKLLSKSNFSALQKIEVTTKFAVAMPLISTTDNFSYLQTRKISKKTSDKFLIKSFDQHISDTFNQEHLFLAGLSSPYRECLFRTHPILFPFWLDSTVSFIQGRMLETHPDKPKYIGSRGGISSLYNHSVLFRNTEEVFVTEGVLDCLSLYELGYGECLGMVGINFKPEWLNDFKRVKKIWIATDNDEAGQKAAQELQQTFSNLSCAVKRFEFPKEYKDINEMLLNK